MATLNRSLAGTPARDARERPVGGVRFDLAFSLLAFWIGVGLYVDGYAHNHGMVDETFFTPYHALLYSGILAVGLFLGVSAYRNTGKGYSFLHLLPYGYNLSLAGVCLFLIGGMFDLVWHTLFGFEANLSALLSPSHLLLASAGFLIGSGPLRAAWQRTRVAPTWGNLLPVLLALLMLLSTLTFFTQFSNAFAHVWGYTARVLPSERWYMDILGVAHVLIPNAITMGVLLFALRRWTLPRGAVTLIVTANAAAMMALEWSETRQYWYLIFAALAAGVVGDLLLHQLKPSSANPLALRAFGFAVPFVLYLTYFLLLIWQVGIWWEIHMWLGVTFFAAVTGVLLSYLALPPALPLPDDPA